MTKSRVLSAENQGADRPTMSGADRLVSWSKIATAGVVIGVLAFSADYVPGIAGAVLIGLVSSGAAWGTFAAIIGFYSRSGRSAVIRSSTMLGIGITVYYLAILLVGQRWNIAGTNLITGESNALYGLGSVAKTWGLWLLLSIAIGAVVGLLGHIVGNGASERASAAAGLITGLLLAEGLSAALWSWSGYWLFWVPGQEHSLALIVTMLVGVAVPILLLKMRKLRATWPIYLAATALSSARDRR